ncbi:MAG TPA: sulfite exporter TauE/SafE family protein, partial [Gemmatimonadaceae bacterium]|nr:sulfite exporter TauE/SafE family protein [Gemmatimonadaceae bacterium]
MFEVIWTIAAFVAGAIAAVTGFGIGSVLTPLLAVRQGMKLAVAVVAVPHVVGTIVRFWMLRSFVDRHVLRRFGLTSAAGGLIGAVLHAYATSRWLTFVFVGLLLLAATAEFTGFMRRIRIGRTGAWIAGALSGALGGLVGNQGGIRSAALLAFDVEKRAFVATATAIALMVDAARLPVYVATEASGMIDLRWMMLSASIAVVLGTWFGARVL